MGGNGDGKIIKKEYITTENINKSFAKYNVPKEFDLLSIDIDSNGYWIWKLIRGYSPRVVVIEYNSSFLPAENKTIKYDPTAIWNGINYFGAGLLALVKLGKSKRYTLIGYDNSGIARRSSQHSARNLVFAHLARVVKQNRDINVRTFVKIAPRSGTRKISS